MNNDETVDTVNSNILFPVLLQMPLFKVGNSGGIFGSTIQKKDYLVASEYLGFFLITVPGRNTNAIDILFLNLSRLLLRAC